MLLQSHNFLDGFEMVVKAPLLMFVIFEGHVAVQVHLIAIGCHCVNDSSATQSATEGVKLM